MSAPQPMQRVLIIPLRFVGDTVLTLPLVEMLKAVWPTCAVDWWASPATATLLKAQPDINNVITEPNRSEDWTPLLKQGRYDAVVLLRQSWTMAKRCRAAGIPVIIGWDRQRFPKPIGFQRVGWYLDKYKPYPAPDTRVHQVHHQAGLIHELTGLSGTIPSQVSLSLTQSIRDKASEWLTSNGLLNKPWVLVNGSTASEQKRLPKSIWVDAIKACNSHSMPVVVSGLEVDRTEWASLAKQHELYIVNSCGETTLPMLASMAQRAAGYLGLDSGPAHLVATNLVSDINGRHTSPWFVCVYGPTNVAQWQPYGVLPNMFSPILYKAGTQPSQLNQHIAAQVKSYLT